jgi:hypothetical protein
MRQILYLAPLAVLITSCAGMDRGVPALADAQSPPLLEPAAPPPDEASLKTPASDLAKKIVQE